MKLLNNINSILAEKFFVSTDTIYEFKDTITFCLENNVYFLRASQLKVESSILKPTEKKRRSLSGTNLHEFLIDNNPYWKEFPKRSKSVMGMLMNGYSHDSLKTIAKYHLNFYGTNFYAIFPKNLYNKKIALSGSEDFIFSFPNIDNIYNLYRVLIDFFIELGVISKTRPSDPEHVVSYNFKSYSHFVSCCKKAENYLYKFLTNYDLFLDNCEEYEKIRTFRVLMHNIFSSYTVKDEPKILQEILDMSLVNWLHEKLKPGEIPPKSNTIIVNKEDLIYNIVKEREFWTEEDCLAVNLNKIVSFFQVASRLYKRR